MENYSKIGITNNITKRLYSYKSHNPDSELHYIYELHDWINAKITESIIKTIHKNKSVGNSSEWFKYTVEELKDFVEEVFESNNFSFNKIKIPSDKNSIHLSNSGIDILLSSKNGMAYRIFFALSQRMDEDNNITMNQNILVDLLNVSRQTIITAINELKSLKLIHTTKINGVNNYHLNEDVVSIKSK